MHSNDPSTRSMRFMGEIEGRPICALIDSGSSHSFVDPRVILGVGCRVVQVPMMVVMVANGEKLVSDTMCEGLDYSIQGHKFKEDMRVLKVHGYDMILGLDWFKRMAPVNVEWDKGMITFKYDDKEGRFVAKEEIAHFRMCEGEVDLQKEVKKGSQIFMTHLFCNTLATRDDPEIYVNQVASSTVTEKEVRSDLGHVLRRFDDVFENRNNFPPKRSIIDHKIELEPGSKLVNQRPYHYSYFQKVELDAIMEELLKSGVVTTIIKPIC
ncbi:hypothetical protein LUZ60_011942 [Juncus effusus]|nr:hypothetical protein LUZ60_011942 [Juncus effusus]